jgi:hypothetical protein
MGEPTIEEKHYGRVVRWQWSWLAQVEVPKNERGDPFGTVGVTAVLEVGKPASLMNCSVHVGYIHRGKRERHRRERMFLPHWLPKEIVLEVTVRIEEAARWVAEQVALMPLAAVTDGEK